MVIAIDGPAGTGKSTIAKRIADYFSISFLNSGSFYRGICLLLLENKKDLENAAEVCDYALRLHIDYIDERLVIDGRDVEDLLHSDMVDRHVAQLSAIPELRSIVNEKIRAITKSQSIVCEGRDMTTVVFPDA